MILLQACFFFLLYWNFITWQSAVYGLFSQAACSSPSTTGLPVVSIDRDGIIKYSKDTVTNPNRQDFTFTLFFKTQLESQWEITVQLISYDQKVNNWYWLIYSHRETGDYGWIEGWVIQLDLQGNF